MNPLKGIDVSAWQHPGDVEIDWTEVKTSGVDFVMIKATQGDNYVNPYLAGDAFGAHSAGLLVGLYHYATPLENDAELQALYAVGAAKSLPITLGLWLDLEESGSVPTFQLGSWVQDWCREVQTAGHTPGLYCDAAYYAMMPGAPFGRRYWCASPEAPEGSHPFMIQAENSECPGVIGPVDRDVLLNPRGLNPAGGKPVAVAVPVSTPTLERGVDDRQTSDDPDPAENGSEAHQAVISGP